MVDRYLAVIRFTPLVIIAFAVSVGFFIFNGQLAKKTEAKEKKLADEENGKLKAEAQKRIQNYESDYKIRQREALDQKLMSLGFAPATSDELNA